MDPSDKCDDCLFQTGDDHLSAIDDLLNSSDRNAWNFAKPDWFTQDAAEKLDSYDPTVVLDSVSESVAHFSYLPTQLDHHPASIKHQLALDPTQLDAPHARQSLHNEDDDLHFSSSSANTDPIASLASIVDTSPIPPVDSAHHAVGPIDPIDCHPNLNQEPVQEETHCSTLSTGVSDYTSVNVNSTPPRHVKKEPALSHSDTQPFLATTTHLRSMMNSSDLSPSDGLEMEMEMYDPSDRVDQSGLLSAADDSHKEFAKPPTTANIRLEDLKLVFHLERPQAEKKLSLKRTTFSNLSRHFGISKWPYRTLRDVQKRCAANDETLRCGKISKEKRRKLLEQQASLQDVVDLIYSDPTESRDSNTLAVLLKIVEARKKGSRFC